MFDRVTSSPHRKFGYCFPGVCVIRTFSNPCFYSSFCFLFSSFFGETQK